MKEEEKHEKIQKQIFQPAFNVLKLVEIHNMSHACHSGHDLDKIILFCLDNHPTEKGILPHAQLLNSHIILFFPRPTVLIFPVLSWLIILDRTVIK